MSNGHMTYAKVQQYLDAIADQALLDVSNAPHGRFWKIGYQEFVAGFVPDNNENDGKMKCEGKPVPIIDQQKPEDTPFLNILRGKWCQKDQMPDAGPFITDEGFTVTLGDGTQVTGQQIQDDILSWLSNGFPET
jgi:hypothetical protein